MDIIGSWIMNCEFWTVDTEVWITESGLWLVTCFVNGSLPVAHLLMKFCTCLVFFVPVFKTRTEIWKGMQTMLDDLYACWDQNGHPGWSTPHVPIVAAPHIPFVSEIIQGSKAENRCILVLCWVVPWICHGGAPSWSNGRFYGLWGVWGWDPYLWGMSRAEEGTQGQTTWFSGVHFTVLNTHLGRLWL